MSYVFNFILINFAIVLSYFPINRPIEGWNNFAKVLFEEAI